MMYRVFGTISSRVPFTRPGRPRFGCLAKWPIALMIALTTERAAFGSSAAMYSASASRLPSAACNHLTRILLPLAQYFLYRAFAGKFSTVRLCDGLLDLCDLPFIQGDILANRLRRQKRFAALH